MKSLRFLLLFGGALITLAAATWPNPNTGLKVGDKAPDFNLRNVDGKMVSLASYENAKGFIVTFTCNTCPYSVMYEDRIIELHNKFAPMGYPVVAIQPNDPEAQPGDAFDKMQARAKEKAFPFAYLFDEGQKIYPVYGATRTPEIYLLDNNLTVRYTGAIDDNAQDATAVSVRYVEDAITALERGENPEPATVKAIGCTIKVKKKTAQ
jgi:peroxiredoxin